MPVHVGAKRKKGYPIIETATGNVKGYSQTKRKAEISASYRNRAYKRKGK